MFFNEKKLRSEGFCKVSMLDPVGIQRALDVFADYQDLYVNRAENFTSTMQIADPQHREEVDRRIRGLVEKQVEVLLPEYEVLFANLILKKRGQETTVGIHTDWTYVDESEFTSYNLWIPLIDVNEDNGCLHVWPKSHLLTSKTRATPYVPFTSEEEKKVLLHSRPVELLAGQGVLYHSGLVHFSNSNHGEADRPAVAMVLKPKESNPIHYFRDAEDSVLKYTVDRNFFFEHTVQEQPIGIEPAQRIGFKPIDLNVRMRQQFSDNANTVSQYYDEWTPAYEEVYGSVIQAFRPSDISELLDIICAHAGIKDGQSLIDAGCGICGPAVHITKRFDVTIDAITVSQEQVKKGCQLIRENGLEKRISCRNADFRFMDGVERTSKDGVLFLESLGHCSEPILAIDASYDVLKKGGFIYIKDFFSRTSGHPKTASRIKRSVQNINAAYAYNVLKLSEILDMLSKAGFVIDFISRFTFESDTNIRAEFESRFDISVFDGGEFELAEWLEIRAIKHFVEDER